MRNTIKVARAEKKITQEDLAKRIRVSRLTINSIEKGRYVPSTVLCLKLAREFDKTVEQLFQLESED